MVGHLLLWNAFVVQRINDASDAFWGHVWLACLPSWKFRLFAELQQFEQEEPSFVSFADVWNKLIRIRICLKLSVDRIHFLTNCRLYESFIIAGLHVHLLHQLFGSFFEIIIPFFDIHAFDHFLKLFDIHLFVSEVFSTFQLDGQKEFLH